MLCGRTPTQRFLEVVWDVRPNKNSFTICHQLSVTPSPVLSSGEAFPLWHKENHAS